VEGILEGESAAAAGRAAGVGNGTAIARRPAVRGALLQVLEDQGVNDSLLARTIREGLEATRPDTYHRDGSLTVGGPDQGIRHKFLGTVLTMRGDLATDAQGDEETWEATIVRIRHSARGAGR
jgi:hypothetical protein